MPDSLFGIVRDENGIRLIPSTIEKESIIFGIRPCDARGIALLDKPFLDEPPDSLYRQRREKTTPITMFHT